MLFDIFHCQLFTCLCITLTVWTRACASGGWIWCCTRWSIGMPPIFFWDKIINCLSFDVKCLHPSVLWHCQLYLDLCESVAVAQPRYTSMFYWTWDETWQDCSSSEYTLIDWVRILDLVSYFQNGGNDLISSQKVLPSGDSTCSVRPSPSAAYAALSAGCPLAIPSIFPDTFVFLLIQGWMWLVCHICETCDPDNDCELYAVVLVVVYVCVGWM